MKKHFKAISFAVISAALLIGCYPKENNLSYSDLDVAITNYNDTINFQDAQVVFLLDTVMHIVEENQTPKGTYDETILRKAKENLSGIFGDRFYVVKDTNDILELGLVPDIVTTIAVMETDYYNYWSYPWWGYWGSWGWGWYWKSGQLKSTTETDNANYYYDPWYPWYPSGGVSYAYTIGSIHIDMIDYKNAKPNEDYLPVAWSGLVNGMRSNNGSNESSRIETQIDQCFSETQSPYFY